MFTTTQPPAENALPSGAQLSPVGRRRPVRLTVEQYEAMAVSGAFGKHDRIELIEGKLVRR